VFHEFDRVDQRVDATSDALHADGHVLSQALAFGTNVRTNVFLRRERRDDDLQFLVRIGSVRDGPSLSIGESGHDDRQVFGEEAGVAPLIFDEYFHVAPQLVDIVPGCERRNGRAEFLLRREEGDCGAEFFLGCEGRQFVFGRESWQNLLHPREPSIDIFEMFVNHRGVHRPHLLGKDGGERTAILASSRRRNDRTAEP
jgi:hypothetical protein